MECVRNLLSKLITDVNSDKHSIYVYILAALWNDEVHSAKYLNTNNTSSGGHNLHFRKPTWRRKKANADYGKRVYRGHTQE